MDKERGFLPEGLTLFDPLGSAKRVARWLFNHVNTEARDAHSDHYRGAAAQLDRELYDKSRGSEDMNRWDDCGSYYNSSLDERIYQSYKDNF